jgi:hypothetical protein
VVARKAATPGVNGGTCDVHKPAATRRAPALQRELDAREAGVGTLGITVGVEPREVRGRGPRELMPEPFDGVVTDAAIPCILDDPDEVPIRQPVVKALESLQCLSHGVGHPVPVPRGDDRA